MWCLPSGGGSGTSLQNDRDRARRPISAPGAHTGGAWASAGQAMGEGCPREGPSRPGGRVDSSPLEQMLIPAGPKEREVGEGGVAGAGGRWPVL